MRDAIVRATGKSANNVTQAHLAAITELDLEKKSITSLKPGDFDGLTALEKLDLFANRLTSLPEGVFSELPALTWLRLTSNRLTSLPEGVFLEVPALTWLYMSYNRLTSLPERVFSELHALTLLYMSDNRLTNLPEGVFSELHALDALDLSSNSLTILPEGVFSELHALTYLSLYGNSLTSLPEGVFSELHALTWLYLNYNPLPSLPEGVFSELHALTTIDLSGNRLRSLPEGVFSELHALTSLKLGDNSINPFPLPISLEKVADGQLRAVAPSGAPFEIVLPLTVTNGSITGGATSITIPVGGVESKTLTVTRIAGTTAAVTVNIGTLPGLPTDGDHNGPYHQGYILVVSSESGLTVLSKLTTPETPADTDATLSLLPSPVQSPAVGEELTLSLNIAGGEGVAGYQATVQFDDTALRYVSSAIGDYLPAGAFPLPPDASSNTVTLGATSFGGESSGDGTLATITFEVIAVKESTLSLSDVLLSDSAGTGRLPRVEDGQITESPQLKGDVNGDGIVNILDLVLVAGRFGQSGQDNADVNGDGIVNILDLVLVAGAFGNAAAPASDPQALAMLSAADVGQWLTQAQELDLTDATSQRGILFLEQVLAVLTPKETVLLPNYPNPFNPETWIPYRLANDTDVRISIYDINGALVRQLDLGYQRAGYYTDRSRAAYWDGRNAFGEPVASGIYFYLLTARDFSATRKMLIGK